jgi:hypothetical protein
MTRFLFKDGICVAINPRGKTITIKKHIEASQKFEQVCKCKRSTVPSEYQYIVDSFFTHNGFCKVLGYNKSNDDETCDDDEYDTYNSYNSYNSYDSYDSYNVYDS